MIIPIRCFTCGKVIAHKWEKYQEMCKEKEKTDNGEEVVKGFHTIRGEILDEIGLTKVCCRRMMLGHVDLIETI